jgi:hypothetical protein
LGGALTHGSTRWSRTTPVAFFLCISPSVRDMTPSPHLPLHACSRREQHRFPRPDKHVDELHEERGCLCMDPACSKPPVGMGQVVALFCSDNIGPCANARQFSQHEARAALAMACFSRTQIILPRPTLSERPARPPQRCSVEPCTMM